MKRKLGIIYLILSYTIFILSLNYLPFLHFSLDLLLIFSIINIFIFIHFEIEIKKIYNFIYNKRYLIGILIFGFLVLGKYNGSSIGLWDGAIQPEFPINNNIVIGKNRPIRSDEWLVGTPVALTQATEAVNFSSDNELLGATSNLVTLNPKLPNKNILSVITNPNSIGFLVFDTERGFSFYWYFGYFLLFFATFEMLMIFTNKNKLLSFLGSIMITLSPVVQWWQSPVIIAYGALAIVFFNNFIISSNWKKKLLFSVLFGYSGLLYIMCIYPAWQIPYGYCYLIFIIWILIKNKEMLRWKDLIYLIPALGVIIGVMCPILISNKEVFEITSNTVYPGARLSTGGGEWRMLFTYVNSIFYPFKNFGNPCEASQYLSFFPIPIIYGVYIIFKNKKADLFIILSSIVLILLSIWVVFPLGTLFSKLTLLYMTTEIRVQVAIGYLSVILLIYIMSKYQTEEIKLNILTFIKLIFSIIITIFIIVLSNKASGLITPGYLNKYMKLILIFIFSICIWLIILNNKKTNYILFGIILLISVLSGSIVSPINKGLDVLYEKPLAHKIREIVKSEPDSKFIAVDSGIILSNYLAVNGAKTINTTNFLPNLSLYYKLDKNKKYEDVYNRYEHVSINLIDKETEFILNQVDSITINLNVDDICITKANYIVTSNLEKDYKNFKEIYNEYNIRIFETDCER